MCAFPGHIPRDEIERRQQACRRICSGDSPDAGGLLVFSRLNIYYLTGSLAAGIFWLPRQGPPVLLCRRGESRARLESPVDSILPFTSFREVPDLLAAAGSPLTTTVAAEMGGISWSLSTLLRRHLGSCTFLPGDTILARARSVKTPWEMERIASAGNRHSTVLQSLLPPFLAPGMTEEAIAHKVWEILFGQGHHGLLRMQNFGEEIFLGHVSAGDSGNYPSVMNGPVGVRGLHPSVPFMGSASTVWHEEQPLTIDVGFSLEGYQTDKTQVYWAGTRESIPARVSAAHDFCIDLQERLVERLLPGATPAELASFAFSRAAAKGWEEGFMGLAGNKVGFIGHGIGLAIDEYPALAPGMELPLEENMVLALEPKIGLTGTGMVGVENTFQVTSSGGRCLTGHDFDIIAISPPGSRGRSS
jgi:Xaa-Pro aminopeptidase